jgi:hypothetical protein
MDLPLFRTKETKREYAARLREVVGEALTDKAMERYTRSIN